MKRNYPLNVSRPTYGATTPSSVVVLAHTIGLMAQPVGRGTQSGIRGQTVGGRGQARVFVLNPRDAQASNAVVTSTLTICSRQAVVLFDSSATQSFVSPFFALCLDMRFDVLNSSLTVLTPIGEVYLINRFLSGCGVCIEDAILLVDLVELEILEFDVILGMDWLSAHHAVLDCFNKVVTLSISGKLVIRYQGDRSAISPCLISTLTARKLLAKGCQRILAYVLDTKIKVLDLGEIPVIKDFLDVFPEKLPRLPLDREIEFGIDVPLGTQLISIPPYRIAPLELKELKTQLQDLLDKGFIRPSTSPWGAPILFVKKKDGSLRLCVLTIDN